MTTTRKRRTVFDGAKLWAIREDDLRMSRADLAEHLAITEAYLWKIENGRAQPSLAIRWQIIEKLVELKCGDKDTVYDTLVHPAEQVAA